MSSKSDTPWLEKYRPTSFKDIVGNEDIVLRLEFFSKHGNIPNLILSGAPGIGKTTSILCLARIMLGDHFNDAVINLNASDDRGIDVVRDKIKMFSKRKLNLPAGRQKIVILDEADSMTEGAQQALRRIMETYSDTTRFAFACNNSEKIIEPIQSRCAILRLAKLSDAQILKRLTEISKAEHVVVTDDGYESLIYVAQGDMRKAVNSLQIAQSTSSIVNSDLVFKVCDQPHPMKLKEMIEKCAARDVHSAVEIIQDLWRKGYSAQDIISNTMRICKTQQLPEFVKLQFLKEIGLCHKRIVEGHASLIQLTGLVGALSSEFLE